MSAGVIEGWRLKERPAFHRRVARRTLTVAMMPRGYLAVSIAAIATAVVAAGCSGNASDDAVMRATLSGDGCRYEGTTTPAPGTFAVEVRNNTNKPATFVLMMLPKDATLKDVEAWFHQARQKWRQTGKYVLRPIAWLSNTQVAAHSASELSVNMFRRARLALLCAPWNQRPFDIIAVAELDVTPNG